MNIRCTRYDSNLTTKLFKFGFCISKSSTYGESTRKTSVWSNKRIIIIIWFILIRRFQNLNLLNLWCWYSVLQNCLSLINVPTCVLNSIKLFSFAWFMVFRELYSFYWNFNLQFSIGWWGSQIFCKFNAFFIYRLWGQGSAISYIDNIETVINNHKHESTRTRFIIGSTITWMSLHQKLIFSLISAFSYSSFDISWKFWLMYYIVV